jgi:hypothetical protein
MRAVVQFVLHNNATEQPALTEPYLVAACECLPDELLAQHSACAVSVFAHRGIRLFLYIKKKKVLCFSPA